MAPVQACRRARCQTNYNQVLLCLARSPDMTLREVVQAVDITEHAVRCIMRDLEKAEILTCTGVGRRNHYATCGDKALRHRETVGNLLALLLPGER